MVKIKTNKGVFICEVVKENVKTLWVKLPDGKIIKRKKKRDLLS